MPVPVVIIGCGGIFKQHLRGYDRYNKSSPGLFYIAATVDINEEAARAAAREVEGCGLCAPGECVGTTDMAAALAGPCSAVDIMVPHHLHEEIALQCIAAGKSIFLEKPISTDLPSARRILQAAKDAGLFMMIAENSQYWPQINMARDVIKEGGIGDLITARATYFESTRGKEWGWRKRVETAGGGTCIDGGAHWIRPLRILMGEIDAVVASLSPYRQEDWEVESVGTALFRLKNGRIATFETIVTGGYIDTEHPWLRITGTGGEISIGGFFEESKAYTRIVNAANPDGKTIHGGGFLESYLHQMDDFLNSLCKGTPPRAGPECALGELNTALAIYESARTNQWVSVAEAPAPPS